MCTRVKNFLEARALIVASAILVGTIIVTWWVAYHNHGPSAAWRQQDTSQANSERKYVYQNDKIKRDTSNQDQARLNYLKNLQTQNDKLRTSIYGPSEYDPIEDADTMLPDGDISDYEDYHIPLHHMESLQADHHFSTVESPTVPTLHAPEAKRISPKSVMRSTVQITNDEVTKPLERSDRAEELTHHGIYLKRHFIFERVKENVAVNPEKVTILKAFDLNSFSVLNTTLDKIQSAHEKVCNKITNFYFETEGTYHLNRERLMFEREALHYCESMNYSLPEVRTRADMLELQTFMKSRGLDRVFSNAQYNSQRGHLYFNSDQTKAVIDDLFVFCAQNTHHDIEIGPLEWRTQPATYFLSHKGFTLCPHYNEYQQYPVC